MRNSTRKCVSAAAVLLCVAAGTGLQAQQAARSYSFTPVLHSISYAGVWRNNIREEALRVRLNTDSHSPGRYRVLGPLSNLPEFHRAFGCSAESAMWRPEAERPTIW